jgi:hypothetical protein
MEHSGGGQHNAMGTDYRIESTGNAFIVIDNAGEQVGAYPTEVAAQQEIERCKKEDAMWEAAERLVDEAIKSHMKMFDVDRQTAAYWINSATGGT